MGTEIATGLVYRIAAVPGTSIVVAGHGDDEHVRRWDVLTGDPVGEPLPTEGRVETTVAVLAGPTGRALIAAAGSRDFTQVRLWDAETDEPAGAMTGFLHDSTIDLVAVPTPGGDLLARTGASGWITLLNLVTLAPVGPALRGHTQGDGYTVLPTR